jgi:hypothetical protein
MHRKLTVVQDYDLKVYKVYEVCKQDRQSSTNIFRTCDPISSIPPFPWKSVFLTGQTRPTQPSSTLSNHVIIPGHRQQTPPWFSSRPQFLDIRNRRSALLPPDSSSCQIQHQPSCQPSSNGPQTTSTTSWSNRLSFMLQSWLSLC